MAISFTRYNESSKYFEYDSSVGKDGSGPWLLLPIDASQITAGALVKARQHAQTAYKDEGNTFTATGNNFDEILAVDKGLQFPATQVASSGANDFDDYEEGTWTPVLGGATSESGQTYDIQVGRYAKWGKTVYAFFYTKFTAKGTITGNLRYKGLPFTSQNTTNVFGPGYCVFFSSLAVGLVFLAGYVSTNATTAVLIALTGAATGVSEISTVNVDDTSSIMGVFIYEANA